MSKEVDTISFRSMTAADIGSVPIGHQGEADEVRQRIADLGSSALLAFDGEQHVGQLDDTEERDLQYQGRGIGLRLLDHFLDWATRAEFEAVVAKVVPAPRPIMAFMDGQPTKAYQNRGFEVVASWVDAELKAVATDKGIIPNDVSPDDAARVSCVVRRLR